MSSADQGYGGMSLIVKAVVRLLLGFIVMFGVYVVLTGHLSPGGGFAGGVILAAGFLLMILAFGASGIRERTAHRFAVTWESLGALGFLAVALLGFMGGAFFASFFKVTTGFHLLSGGAIPISNVSIGVKVAAGLFGAFLMLAAFRPGVRGVEDEGE